MSIDTHSETWHDVKRFAQIELDRQISFLQDFNCDHRQSDHIRGKIAVLRAILSLPDQKNTQKV